MKTGSWWFTCANSTNISSAEAKSGFCYYSYAISGYIDRIWAKPATYAYSNALGAFVGIKKKYKFIFYYKKIIKYKFFIFNSIL